MSDFFASYPDPVVRYREGDRPTVTAVNPAFVRQFSVDADELVEEPVEAALTAVGIDVDVGELESEAGEAVPDSDEDDPSTDTDDSDNGAGHTDTDAVPTGLTAEGVVTGAGDRHYAIRQIDTDDGGYLLLTDVSATVERRRALEADNDRLEGFARIVSHDLRNPLEVAQSRLMAARETGDEIHFEKTEAAHTRIRELVEDVLTLARSGRTISETEPVDLAAVVSEAWETVDAPAATLDIDAELGPITADRERLRTLFENLFRNSVEHVGTNVSISVESTGGGFVVADDGPGIPSDRRDEVFEAGVSTGNGTTGLGLSIVSDIAAAHGWTVSLTDGPDGGAQFAFDHSSA